MCEVNRIVSLVTVLVLEKISKKYSRRFLSVLTSAHLLIAFIRLSMKCSYGSDLIGSHWCHSRYPAVSNVKKSDF